MMMKLRFRGILGDCWAVVWICLTPKQSPRSLRRGASLANIYLLELYYLVCQDICGTMEIDISPDDT